MDIDANLGEGSFWCSEEIIFCFQFCGILEPVDLRKKGRCFVFIGSLWLLGLCNCLAYSGMNPEVKALMDIKKSLMYHHGVLNWDTKAMDPGLITCSHYKILSFPCNFPSSNVL